MDANNKKRCFGWVVHIRFVENFSWRGVTLLLCYFVVVVVVVISVFNFSDLVDTYKTLTHILQSYFTQSKVTLEDKSKCDCNHTTYSLRVAMMVYQHRCSSAFAFIRNVVGTGPWFNIKMSSYQYRKSHCGDKTVVRSSYLHNGISYTGKMSSLYWIGALITKSPSKL